MTRERAIQILESRKMITEAGKYRLKVTTCNPNYKVRTSEKGSVTQVAIANLSAMSPYHLDQAKSLLAEGEFQPACNNQFAIGILEGQYVPVNGETVDVDIETILNKDGIPILVVSSLREVKAKTDLRKVSLGDSVPAAASEGGDIA